VIDCRPTLPLGPFDVYLAFDEFCLHVGWAVKLAPQATATSPR
jgi:hypothetical protein